MTRGLISIRLIWIGLISYFVRAFLCLFGGLLPSFLGGPSGIFGRILGGVPGVLHILFRALRVLCGFRRSEGGACQCNCQKQSGSVFSKAHLQFLLFDAKNRLP